MSKYTTEVRFICENSAGLSESKGADNVDSILDKCWNKVFNFDFPIFDENYRQVLCRKILKHYYTREIAHETVGRWKLALNAKLNEIMPYYNQLYKSELLEFNPFYDVDLTRNREGNGTSNKTSNNTETNSGTSKNVSSESGTNNTDTLNRFSDTPQNSMDTQGIADSVPLTTVTKVNEDNTTTNESTDTLTRNDTKTENGTENINNTDKYIETVKGKQGTENYSSLLKKFRETFLNIDMMIIEDCSDCFFTLW
nr:MAG TPA: Lower collar protein [Caudoviricetes sp.]